MINQPGRHNDFHFSNRSRRTRHLLTFPAGIFFLPVLAAFLSGCLHLSSEITNVSSDTYRLRREGDDSLKLRRQAWRDAEIFCTNKDQYFMLARKDYSEKHYQLTFRCLAAGDPELLESEDSSHHWLHQKTLGGYGKYEY